MTVGSLFHWQSHSSVEVAFALAASREGPHDLGPELLLWFYSGDDTQTPAAFMFAKIAIVKYCARNQTALSQEMLERIAWDALRKLASGAMGMDAASRAKALHIREDSYRRLRNAAVRHLISAIRSAHERFRAALLGPEGSIGPDRYSDNEPQSIAPKAA